MSESASNLEKWAERIRALLAKAESTEHKGEAATYRAKAEELMRKYRIAEEDLIAEDAFSILPVSRDIIISTPGSAFFQEHWYMWTHTVTHTGCRTNHKWIGGQLVATVVGYASDIRMAEFLYQQAYARTFSSRYAARLHEARNAVDSVLGGLELHGRKARVDEAFYALFPQFRPETEEQKAARVAAEAQNESPNKKTPARRKGWTKAEENRYYRENHSPAALAGRSAGRTAADTVEISRTHTKAQRVEAGEPIRLSGIELGN